MAAGCEIEAHEGIAGLQQRQEHRLVHLAARIGLNIRKVGAEQLLGALDRQRFGDIDPFTAAIVAVARIAFGVFVGHHRALRFQNGPADDVFGRDQLDLVPLPAELALDRGGDLRIGLRQRRGEKRIGRGSGLGTGGRGAGAGWSVHRRNIPNRRNLLSGVAVGLEVAVGREARLAYRAAPAKHLRYPLEYYARYGGDSELRPLGFRTPPSARGAPLTVKGPARLLCEPVSPALLYRALERRP